MQQVHRVSSRLQCFFIVTVPSQINIFNISILPQALINTLLQCWCNISICRLFRLIISFCRWLSLQVPTVTQRRWCFLLACYIVVWAVDHASHWSPEVCLLPWWRFNRIHHSDYETWKTVTWLPVVWKICTDKYLQLFSEASASGLISSVWRQETDLWGTSSLTCFNIVSVFCQIWIWNTRFKALRVWNGTSVI